MDIITGNDLICKYLGWIKSKRDPNFYQVPNLYPSLVDTGWTEFHVSDIYFHDNLHYLMPVIVKINKEMPVIFDFSISLTPLARLLYVPKMGTHKYFISDEKNDTTPEQAIYSVVVAFLTWHQTLKA